MELLGKVTYHWAIICVFTLETHWLMLKLAIKEANTTESLGQIFRLFLVIPGHILRRLPIGNVGTTRVSAFRKMEIPTDLQDLLR